MIPIERPRTEPPALPALLHRRLRASPDYRLVAHGELQGPQRELFAQLAEAEDHYGLLIPIEVVQSGVKAVGHDVARLFRSLGRPARLPHDLLPGEEATQNALLAALVLDGVLEVEVEGELLTGPAASPALGERRIGTGDASVTSALSRRALRLAWELPLDDPARLSTWIYGSNTIPLGPAWLRRLESAERLRAQLGLQRGGRNRRLLADDFVFSTSGAWQSWSRRERDDAGHLGYKLYVSPHPRALLEAFDALVDVLVSSGVSAFKLGTGAAGLLRADKLVIYLDGWESLRALAVRIERALSGVTAQGVPFTAPLGADGLLSWGMDPPPAARPSGWGTVESWRSWLTNRLARAILHARSRGLDRDRGLAYAALRLRIEGVDTDLWVPAASLWRAGGASA